MVAKKKIKSKDSLKACFEKCNNCAIYAYVFYIIINLPKVYHLTCHFNGQCILHDVAVKNTSNKMNQLPFIPSASNV